MGRWRGKREGEGCGFDEGGIVGVNVAEWSRELMWSVWERCGGTYGWIFGCERKGSSNSMAAVR